jgi:hypothetical protein
MKIFSAFKTGLHWTNQSKRMVLFLYIINFVFAAVLALPFRSALKAGLGNSMSAEQLLYKFDYTLFIDFMNKHGERISTVFTQVLWVALFYVFVNTLLAGGILAVLRSDDRKFSMKSFFAGCGIYFFRFLRLFLVSLLFFLLAFILYSILNGIFGALTSNATSEVLPFILTIVALVFFLFLISIVVMIFDYAKIATVVNDSTAMFKTAWGAVKFVARNFGKTLALQYSIFLILVIFTLIYLLIDDMIGMTAPLAIFLMFIVQQVSISLRLWIRILSFASELALYEGLRPAVGEQQTTPTNISDTEPLTPPLPEGA